MSERISVPLGERSYDVHVGPRLLDRAGELLEPFANGPIPIVTDAIVGKLHLDALVAALGTRAIAGHPIVIPAGEKTKSFADLQRLIGALLKTGVDRGGLIIALGGGVVGDLTGFAAGILKRGIDFVQIPTTLLAQVDSSVGGKTAINVSEGKNLVGIFHQPRCVIADTELLKTLPRRELLAGYAEVVKYGALGDRNFFEWLEGHGARALAGDGEAMVRVVSHSCRMKAEIVARDEREGGERALLNLGHTFGHALEASTGYSDKLLHGESVAIGMVLAFALSARLGICNAGELDRLRQHLKSVGLPTAISDIAGTRSTADELLAHMAHDKKSRDGVLSMILVRGIGTAFVTRDIPIEDIRAVLAA